MKKNTKNSLKEKGKKDPKIEAKIKRLSALIRSVGHPVDSVKLVRKYR